MRKTNFKEASERLADFSYEKRKKLRARAKNATEYLRSMLTGDTRLYCVTEIARDFGMSSVQMNTLLCDYGVQWCIDTPSRIHVDYDLQYELHYAERVPFSFVHKTDGRSETKFISKWTAAGRVFILNLMLELGIDPIEKAEPAAAKAGETAEVAEQSVAEKAEESR